MAGLAAARALADFFERVIVLENDALPKEAANRAGTPQSRHAHALLLGGLHALIRLFPGFEKSLSEAGAIPLRVGYDYRIERPGYDPFPQRDFGIHVYSMTRPLLELTVRQRLAEYRNVEIRDCCRVHEFIAAPHDAAVTAVRCQNPDGTSETVPADLVIDASGHGRLTLNLLESTGLPVPDESWIGVDVGYATALFDTPHFPPDCLGVFTFPHYPHNKRAALILPVEGNRWILTLVGRYEDKPPADWDRYLQFASDLRTPTVYNAIRHANAPPDIARAGFKGSCWRHFERLEKFPRGLLPLGDAICRFNPVYGQGMSVGVMEADALHHLLSIHGAETYDSSRLAVAFFERAKELIDTPWSAAAIPDFIDPRTEGQRPPDLEHTFRFFAALIELAAEDAAVHRLFIEVQNLLKPRSAYNNPELVERVKASIARAQTAS
jgi:2-polyprenyl-6-methoxyphenol hydroxylase-like FAD-dependent oxidoreductase